MNGSVKELRLTGDLYLRGGLLPFELQEFSGNVKIIEVQDTSGHLPRYIGGDLTAMHCEFTSLDFMQDVVVNGEFALRFCNSFTSMRGCPKASAIEIRCCNRLSSVEGIAQDLQACDIKSVPIASLAGLRLQRNGILIVGFCDKLKDLSGLQASSLEKLNVHSCKGMKSLKGLSSVTSVGILDLELNINQVDELPASCSYASLELNAYHGLHKLRSMVRHAGD